MKLYDERVYSKIKNFETGYNGFTMMNIKDSELKLEYFDIKDNLVVSEKWTADIQSGEIKNTELKVDLNDPGIILIK
ncbi:MAG: hypothetical protein IPM38_12045 [Ignavibacteria bacterium]|nr:hypothetical protein [Ignavibacteria bacterium]